MGNYDQKIWGQIGLNNADSMYLSTGFNFQKLQIGYSFGIPFRDEFSNLISSNHQISLSTRLAKKNKAENLN
jgi:Type IX secretion system membrane protein PorP/SprF